MTSELQPVEDLRRYLAEIQEQIEDLEEEERAVRAKLGAALGLERGLRIGTIIREYRPGWGSRPERWTNHEIVGFKADPRDTRPDIYAVRLTKDGKRVQGAKAQNIYYSLGKWEIVTDPPPNQE